MITKRKNFNKFLALFIKIFFSINIFNCTSVEAFVPYIYEPNPKELKQTGINIARTAVQLLKLGQAKEASRLAALAVTLNPKDDRLWAILGESQLRNNNLSQAKISFSKAKNINPEKASLWFAEASLALKLKELDNAVSLIKEGLKLEPKNAGAYFQLGNARIMQNKFYLAINSFKKATELKPLFWEALNNEGIVLFEIGKIEKSIKIWRRVLKIQNNAEPKLALAIALHQTKMNKIEAIKLAKEALNENPNYISSNYQKEQLWGTKLQKAAKVLFSNPQLESYVERAMANSD